MISPIFEKTLNREIEHVKNDEFAILTAWRGGLSATKNLERMRQIQKALSTYNFGFVKMDGVGQEVGGESVEKSLLVLNGRKTPNFRQMMIDLAAQFDQDFLVYGKGGKSELLDQSGNPVQTFTNVEAGVDQFYSKVASGAFHLVENNTNMSNFKKKSEVVGISEAVNPRIKALQDQLSKVVKTPVEITIRGEKEFTVTCEGNNVQAINAVKTFLGNQAQWGEIGYDQEGDMSFGYFTIVEMATESIVESSMRIMARYFREKPWSSIKESVKVELQKIAKSKPGTRTYESAIMSLAGITSGKPDLIKSALTKFVIHESALTTLTEGGAEDQYKMYDKLEAEGFKLAEASRCIMSAINTDGKAELKDLERYVEKFTRLGQNNPKESSFGRTYGEIAAEYKRAIDFIKSGKHKNLMNESAINEEKFSLINVKKSEGGKIIGSWVQDHVGTLETAIKAAKDTETANSNRLDIAVVSQLPGASPNFDTKIGLDRLDTQRVMNPDKMFGEGKVNEGVIPQNVDNWMKTESTKELRDAVRNVQQWLGKAGVSIKSGGPSGPKPQGLILNIKDGKAADMKINPDGSIRFYGQLIKTEKDLIDTLKANESINESKKFTGNENPDDLFDGEYVTSTGKPIDEQLPSAHKDYTKADHLEASQFHYIRAGHMEDMADSESDEEALDSAMKFRELGDKYEAAAKSVRESIQERIRNKNSTSVRESIQAKIRASKAK